MTLRVRPEAMSDIRSAMAWYNEREAGLGAAFLEQTDAVFGRIVEQPAHFPIVYREFRRALMRRFPYAVYFIARDEAVIAFAVLHHRRDRTPLSDRR